MANMHQVIRQLERLRRVGRLMLFSQHLLRWAAAVLVMLLLITAADYALRLPGWLRLVIGVGTVVVVLVWFVRWMKFVVLFRPDLSVLAMRAERLYPQLAGVLASGVEFAAHEQDYADPQRTRILAQASMAKALRRLEGRPLSRLIKPVPTLRVAGLFALVLIASGSIVAAAPTESWLAVRRWFNPFGDAHWPKRTQIRSLVDARAWAHDTPLPLEVRIHRGYQRGTRAWVVYETIDAEGRPSGPRKHLMTEQSGGDRTFVRLIDFQVDAEAAAYAGLDAAFTWSTFRFHFEAGDDRTTTQSIELVQRPSVRSAVVHTEPPTYARGLVLAQSVALEGSGLKTLPPALVGSRVTIRFELNEATVVIDDQWDRILPGFAELAARDGGGAPAAFGFEDGAIEAQFTLTETAESGVFLVDEYGFANMSERVYRIEAVEDKLPSVSMAMPSSEQSVLATAVVDLKGAARDDVGVDRLSLWADVARGDDSPDAATSSSVQLNQITGRRAEMAVLHSLDLASWGLRPGDQVVLTAMAQDVFELDGERHDPVRSSPHTLHIIDQTTLVGQIRGELAGLRQQAVRLEMQQRQVMKTAPDVAAPRQRTLARRLATQRSLARRLLSRIELNRLDEADAEPLQQLLEQVQADLDAAVKASDEAVSDLEQSQAVREDAERFVQQALGHQRRVRAALERLIQLLDQGGEALALQMGLRQMLSRQSELADDTRKLMPQTLGQPVERLGPDERQQLDDLADRQNVLTDQAGHLVSQMESTSEVLSRQSQDVKDQAAATALAEAASIAQRQGLEQSMQQAGNLTQQNRLSSAGQQQQQVMQMLEQMLDQLNDQARQQQQILRRRLWQLAESIRSLVEQQETQLRRLEGAEHLPPLGEPMSRVWRNTQAVRDQAAGVAQKVAVVPPLDKAVTRQASAITALRSAESDEAETAEREALDQLVEALKLVEQTTSRLDQQAMQARRDELGQAYLALAKRQIELRGMTEPYMGLARPSRPDRLALVQLGNDQADVRNEAADLRQKVEKTVVFEHIHGWINASATRAADRLRAAETDPAIAVDQASTASMLETMAAAMEQPELDEPFAGDNVSGGGGGETQGAGASGLVPPVAELKLLRGMQREVYRRTRAFGGQPSRPVGADDGPSKKRLQRLAVEQRELVGLSKRLVDALYRRQESVVPGQSKPQ